MDFSEFKRRIGAEPLSTDPELLDARRSAAEFEQAAREAEAFEARLGKALRVKVDEPVLLGEILDIPGRARPAGLRWLAIAASVLLVIGAGGIAWYRASQPGTVQEYVAYHYRHDGADVLSKAKPDFDRTEVNRILARFGMNASPELVSQVSYIKICPTLHGHGAHMVLATAEGPVTVIFMPDTTVTSPVTVRFDKMAARVVALASGSAAIIASPNQPVGDLGALLRNDLTPIAADA